MIALLRGGKLGYIHPIQVLYVCQPFRLLMEGPSLSESPCKSSRPVDGIVRCHLPTTRPGSHKLMKPALARWVAGALPADSYSARTVRLAARPSDSVAEVTQPEAGTPPRFQHIRHFKVSDTDSESPGRQLPRPLWLSPGVTSHGPDATEPPACGRPLTA